MQMKCHRFEVQRTPVSPKFCVCGMLNRQKSLNVYFSIDWADDMIQTFIYHGGLANKKNLYIYIYSFVFFLFLRVSCCCFSLCHQHGAAAVLDKADVDGERCNERCSSVSLSVDAAVCQRCHSRGSYGIIRLLGGHGVHS